MIERKINRYGDKDQTLEVEHRFGRRENDGDVEMSATAGADMFSIDVTRSIGRDIDNYDAYKGAEIDLNPEEARELYLLLHVWLERRT